MILYFLLDAHSDCLYAINNHFEEELHFVWPYNFKRMDFYAKLKLVLYVKQVLSIRL